MSRARASNTMQTVAWWVLLALALAPGAQAASDGADDYAVEWFTIDAGGGDSSGAGYAIQGTLAQPDAEPLHPAAGGVFELTGGFWALPIAQAPVQPLLVDSFESP